MFTPRRLSVIPRVIPQPHSTGDWTYDPESGRIGVDIRRGTTTTFVWAERGRRRGKNCPSKGGDIYSLVYSSRESGQWVWRWQRHERKGVGLLGGKTPTVYLAERKRRNGGSNGPVSVSRKWSSNKEVARPAYQAGESWKRRRCIDRTYRTRYFSGGPQHQQRLAAATEMVKMWELSQRESKIKNMTWSWHHSMSIPVNYNVRPVIFSCFVYALLIFRAPRFSCGIRNLRTWEIIMECTSYRQRM